MTRGIYIPGAGPADTRPVAKLAVDGNESGTITPAASTGVSNALAFVGGEVPPEIIQAMKQYVGFLYAGRGDDAEPSSANEYPPAFKAPFVAPSLPHRLTPRILASAAEGYRPLRANTGGKRR